METNKFEINVDDMQVLNNDERNTLSNPRQPNSSSPPIRHDPSPQLKQNGNVQNVEEDGNGFFITGINTKEKETVDEEEPVGELEEAYVPDPVDSYKHVAVVDCSKAFSSQEVSNITNSSCFFFKCALVSEKSKSITYLNVANQVQFKFDTLVTSHAQV